MNKLWLVLEITEIMVAVIGIPLFVISLIINVICDVAGFESTIVFEITDYICHFILDYILPVFMFLFVFNGFHAVDYLLNKHD